jgi:hypothetical protein
MLSHIQGLPSVANHTVQKIEFMYFRKRNCAASVLHSCVCDTVSDLYISRIGPHIWLQQNRQTNPGNI